MEIANVTVKFISGNKFEVSSVPEGAEEVRTLTIGVSGRYMDDRRDITATSYVLGDEVYLSLIEESDGRQSYPRILNDDVIVNLRELAKNLPTRDGGKKTPFEVNLSNE